MQKACYRRATESVINSRRIIYGALFKKYNLRITLRRAGFRGRRVVLKDTYASLTLCTIVLFTPRDTVFIANKITGNSNYSDTTCLPDFSHFLYIRPALSQPGEFSGRGRKARDTRIRICLLQLRGCLCVWVKASKYTERSW